MFYKQRLNETEEVNKVIGIQPVNTSAGTTPHYLDVLIPSGVVLYSNDNVFSDLRIQPDIKSPVKGKAAPLTTLGTATGVEVALDGYKWIEFVVATELATWLYYMYRLSPIPNRKLYIEKGLLSPPKF
ncbi:MAG TPA: hypothetical protein DCM71_10020 [Runella sp.]|nr:hypothetical protein [Runella sp.]